MLVAERLGLPLFTCDQKQKKTRRLNQVILQKGQNVIVVEDLISTGNSSLLAVEAFTCSWRKHKGMAAIFTYGFDVADQNFKNAKSRLIYFK
jgi:orotate phosphoribosyltransferase